MKDLNEEDILKKAAQIVDGGEQETKNDGLLSEKPKDIIEALNQINIISRNIRTQSNQHTPRMKNGDSWSHLKIIEKIGQGGVGEVYSAYDPILDSTVAVKFLNKKSQLYVKEQQFLDEARHMAAVRHPHVLAIHGATIDNDIAGYWSDFLDGQLLSDFITSKKTNWSQQLEHAMQLCQAVKAIHKNQLVHGDIKALNVMLQPQRGAILLDFGSSRKKDIQISENYIQQASPMAMAPEQFSGGDATHASDIFSLGLVFWQLCAQEHPLQDINMAEIKQKINQLSSYENLLTGSRPWKKLILSMVNADPEKRPNITEVETKLIKIQNAPIRKAKLTTMTSVLVLAAGITSISSYSNYKTSQAQKETQALNTILSDILLKSSPVKDGKDVLLIDVLNDAEAALIENTEISQQQKNQSLLELVKTYRHQGKHQKSIDLATKLLNGPQLSDSLKMELLMQKSAGLTENKNYAESEALLLEAVKIKATTEKDATIKLSSLITLIRTYNESYQLEKVPPLINEAKKLWRLSTIKEAALANIYLVEGNYFEIKEQYQNAYSKYQLSIENFILYYGEKNIDVMIAEGAAATVLTYDKNTLELGIEELKKVVAKMTEFLGGEHSSTLIARINLASAYAQNDSPEEAIDSIVPYMPLVIQAYGETGGMTLHFKRQIANFYKDNQNHDDAVNELNEIISIQNVKHGSDNALTLKAQLNLAIYLTETHQLSEAYKLVDLIHHTAKEALPHNHRTTLDIQNHRILILHLLNDQTAKPKMAELIEVMVETLGADDPSTLSAMRHLESMQ